MTYADRYTGNVGAGHVEKKLQAARQQAEYSFENEVVRQIPQVKEMFDKIDAAMTAAAEVRRIFGGNGTHRAEDFFPDESGTSANDRAMAERDRQRGIFP